MDLVIYLLAAFFAGFLLARFMIAVIRRGLPESKYQPVLYKLRPRDTRVYTASAKVKKGDVVAITQKDAEEYAKLAYGLEELIKERANK